MSGFLVFSWWDLLKLAAAATIYHEVAKRWPVIPGR
jgi:biotin transporter BioY